MLAWLLQSITSGWYSVLKLRQLRIDKGYSLSQLSEKSGISISYLNEIEKGKKYPKTEKIIALGEALGCSYELSDLPTTQ